MRYQVWKWGVIFTDNVCSSLERNDEAHRMRACLGVSLRVLLLRLLCYWQLLIFRLRNSSTRRCDQCQSLEYDLEVHYPQRPAGRISSDGDGS